MYNISLADHVDDWVLAESLIMDAEEMFIEIREQPAPADKTDAAYAW